MQHYRDLVLAFRELELDGSRPALVHASLSAFGQVKGRAEAVVGALFEHFSAVVAPTFTYKTMIVPELGPPNNAIEYGKSKDANKMAQFFTPKMPADKLMGIIPETLRRHHLASRSMHPILSFSGVNAKQILKTQTLKQPLAPIAALADQQAWVLLLGVRHTANTSIHLGERLAKRKTFTRWALVPDKTIDTVVECPGYPPCSDGFDAVAEALASIVRQTAVGETVVQAIPLTGLLNIVRELVLADPLALLCESQSCPRCNVIRNQVWEMREKMGQVD